MQTLRTVLLLLGPLIALSTLLSSDVVVEWYAPVQSGGGYCSEALAFIAALRGLGMTVVAKQHGDSPNHAFVNGLTSADRALLAPLAPEAYINPATGKRKRVVAVCHSEPGAWTAPEPRYSTKHACPPRNADLVIGRTMFETDKLPTGWSFRIAYVDEVWVPTEFAKGIFLAAGVAEKKIRVVGEPVNTDFFRPVFDAAGAVGGRELDDNESGERAALALEALGRTEPLAKVAPYLRKGYTIILFVGKWEDRKGITTLLNAVYEEFGSSGESSVGGGGAKALRRVLLLIVTSTYHSSDDFESLVRAAVGDAGASSSPQVARLILTALPQAQMPLLFSLPRSFLVIPSSGEGWGRPHVEAMSCGRPVVATNWSGPTAYLTSANGYPLPIEDELVGVEGWPGHKWAAVSQPDLRATLRRLVDAEATRDEAVLREVATKGREARALMLQNFSLPVMGRYVQNIIAAALSKKFPAPKPAHSGDEL